MSALDKIAAAKAQPAVKKIYLLPSINCRVVSPTGQQFVSNDGIVEVDSAVQPELFEHMEAMLAVGNCTVYDPTGGIENAAKLVTE